MIEELEDSDLPQSSHGKLHYIDSSNPLLDTKVQGAHPFLFVLHADLLQRYNSVTLSVASFEHLAVSDIAVYLFIQADLFQSVPKLTQTFPPLFWLASRT